MKFVLATVIFPKVKEFFPEFIKSLQNQTDQGFQLLIVNDGCQLSDFDFSGFENTILPGGGSITKNREILIGEAYKQNYEWIVFADADDLFEANRIEVIRGFTASYDIIANEIVPFSGQQIFDPKFEKVLGEFKQIDLDFIREKNLLGFSNVACRTRFLKEVVIPDEIIAVDWYLFTTAMQAGARVCFTSATKTYYRQWSDNIIGIDKISDKEITTGVKVKYTHYKNLLNSDISYLEYLSWLQNLYLNIENPGFDTYINKVKQAGLTTTFWWENIKNYGNE